MMRVRGCMCARACTSCSRFRMTGSCVVLFSVTTASPRPGHDAFDPDLWSFLPPPRPVRKVHLRIQLHRGTMHAVRLACATAPASALLLRFQRLWGLPACCRATLRPYASTCASCRWMHTSASARPWRSLSLGSWPRPRGKSTGEPWLGAPVRPGLAWGGRRVCIGVCEVKCLRARAPASRCWRTPTRSPELS